MFANDLKSTQCSYIKFSVLIHMIRFLGEKTSEVSTGGVGLVFMTLKLLALVFLTEQLETFNKVQ